MVSLILCVCTGNTCRSLVAEAALRAVLPGCHVSSTGRRALVGPGVDSAAAARKRDIPLMEHAARLFTTRLREEADLILDRVAQWVPQYDAMRE